MQEPLAISCSCRFCCLIDTFVRRHPATAAEVAQMPGDAGATFLEALLDATIPQNPSHPAAQPSARPWRHGAIEELRAIATKNALCKNYLGQGYSDCITPPVIQRNILENPGWYTAYTPYQAEISQGRMEALVNFQQMVIDLTGLDIANASLLDEATAAAEAMHMAYAASKNPDARAIFVSHHCHPQTIAVVQTRTEALGIELIVADESTFDPNNFHVFAVLLQYPDTTGQVNDYSTFIAKAHAAGALAIVAADILALTLFRPPGDSGPTSRSVRRNASVCRSVTAVRTRRTWRRGTNSSG
jgi:glycine dehydrogenase